MPSPHNELLEKIRQYKIPSRAIELLKSHKPLIIAGATGAGKNAVLHHIVGISDWRRVITHTTRAPRPDEKDGRDYWFVSNQQMLELLAKQAMIEAAVVHGHTIYGASIEAYEAALEVSNKPTLLIDVQGVENLLLAVADLKPIFLLPPSFEEWISRLDKRGAMSHVERLRRLQSAKTELAIALKDERFNLVVNQDITSTTQAVLSGLTDQPTQRRNRELAKMLIDHVNSY